MKFTSSLIKGKLIKRYKRFFTDIEVNNKILIAHCPNTGSMMGLLDKGNDVWLTKHNDPKRKLKYTLEMIKVKKRIIGVNTHRANRIVEHGLNNKLIDRGTRIISELTGLDYAEAKIRLFSADKSVKVAVVMEILDCSHEQAKNKLKSVDGFLYRLIDTQK
mgnify:CR=1 FL=1